MDYLTWTFFIRWVVQRGMALRRSLPGAALPARSPLPASSAAHPARPHPVWCLRAACRCPPLLAACRRLLQNPSYYDLDGTDPEAVSAYLSALVEGVLSQLQDAGCLEVRSCRAGG